MVLAGTGRAGVVDPVVGGHAGSFRCLAVRSGHLVVGVVGACEAVAADGRPVLVVLPGASHRNEGLALGMPLRAADRRAVHPVPGIRFAGVAHRRRIRAGRARPVGIRIVRVKKKRPPNNAPSLLHPLSNRGHCSTFQPFNLSTFQPRRRRALCAFPVASRRAFC